MSTLWTAIGSARITTRMSIMEKLTDHDIKLLAALSANHQNTQSPIEHCAITFLTIIGLFTRERSAEDIEQMKTGLLRMVENIKLNPEETHRKVQAYNDSTKTV